MNTLIKTFAPAIFFLFSLSINALSQEAIQVNVSGSGTPILFLPGFTTPGSVWNETIENLNGSYQYHTVSYAGFNGLAPISTPFYSSIKEAISDYITSNQLKNIVIVGHSMGGMLALDLSAELPNTIKKMIIVDALPCMREVMMPGVSADQIKHDSHFNQQMLNMDDQAFKGMATMMAKSMCDNSQKTNEITSWVLAADRKTYTYGYTDLLKLDLRTGLEQITAKTLILSAPFPSTELAQTTTENQYTQLKDKEIKMAPGGKHFIMFDQPEWFYEQVNTFLGNE